MTSKRSSVRMWHAAAAITISLATACGFSVTSSSEADADASVGDPRPDGAAPDGALVAGHGIDLKTAGTFVVLAKSGISGITATVTGNLGVSPAAATYITGFSLVADPTNVFSTSAQVTGKVFAASYAPPTAAQLTGAVRDMELACTDAAARAPDVTELGKGTIGGMTLAPGVYAWSSGVTITQDVTLTGGPTSVWIFEIAKGLSLSGSTRIVLTGGALPKNVFWHVHEAVSLAAMAHVDGVVLAQTSVTLAAGASVHGRLLAQTAVDIDGSTVIEPVP